MNRTFIKSLTAAFIFIVICAWTGSITHLDSQQTQKKKELPPAQSYTVSKAESEIKIDGVLNEPAWEKAAKIDVPYEWWPGDNIPALVKTECLVTFSRTKVYFGFRCYDPEPKKVRAHLMDRDAMTTFVMDDHVTLLLDTFNDERRGFQFRINALGVQADAFFSELEGFEDFSWDAIWASAGKITDYGYCVEIAIPFNQLRFPRMQGKQTWGICIERLYPRSVRHRLRSHPMSRDRQCFLCQINKVTGFEEMSSGHNLEFDPTFTVNRTDTRTNMPDGELKNGKIKIEPGLSARLGGALLGSELRKFKGSVALALAAYNAGDDVAVAWWKRFQGQPFDVFAEEMTIKETRGYVARVLKSYGIYRWLYEGAQPTLPVEPKLPAFPSP